MSALIEAKSGDRHSVAIETTDAAHYNTTRRRLTAPQRRWLADNAFEAKPGSVGLLSDANGKLVRVLVAWIQTMRSAHLPGCPSNCPKRSITWPMKACLPIAGRRRWVGRWVRMSSRVTARPSEARRSWQYRAMTCACLHR